MCLIISGAGWALPKDTERSGEYGQPLVIVTADKMDSLELFGSELPGVKRLLNDGACGLMNVRSGLGYMDSSSGYLTLGTGSRSTVPNEFWGEKTGLENSGLEFGGAYELRNGKLPGRRAGADLLWSFGIGAETLKPENLVIPMMGWVKNQARMENFHVDPGKLGAFFHENGWRTCLIGNLDNTVTSYRPGGFLLMDRRGIIDEGQISQAILEKDPSFPFIYRFNLNQTIAEISGRLAPRKIMVIEFGDFFRLEACQKEMRQTRYEQLKQSVWSRFNQFLTELFRLKEAHPFTLVVVSPSVSGESYLKKNLLGVMVVNDPRYRPGLLTSGTTKWDGLVANVDFLPTLLKITGIQTRQRLTGRAVSVIQDKNHRQQLIRLNQCLIANNGNQRRVLDWNMGMITFGWLVGLAGILIARKFISLEQKIGTYLGRICDGLITLVAVMPLSMIILPLLPAVFWQVAGFLGLSMIISLIFIQIKAVDLRILILSGIFWAGLILDQLFGWSLIRFSPLGYSAMAGSRYYGMGNEFMGVFLAASLILTHLMSRSTIARWAVPKAFGPLILGVSILVFSLPQLGAKFGGILSGTVGFSYYLIKVYHVKVYNKKLWFILGGFIFGLAAIGWWDSLRAPEVQTHIGRFIRLIFTRDFSQVGEIILRKLTMNLKLTAVSPWMRIISLALGLGIIYRLVMKGKMAQPEDAVLWKSLLVTGLAAYLVNDAGVLAFATCLVYGFSFVLLKNGEHFLTNK
jgi:hypothetical protein